MTVRTLVTGGAGFIGSHLVDHLIAEGEPVTVLDDFSTGKIENLAEACERGDVRIVRGSVLNPADLDEAMGNSRRVFHLAVQCVRRSLRRPIENHATNATGTLLALEAARRAGIERFIYCSSSEVYGNSGSEWLNEEGTICAPVTVYGASKLAGEYYAKAYWQTYGLPVVIVRPFNAYGPREHESGDLAEVIPRFLIRLLNRQPPIVFGSGKNGRDFTYVTEIADGIVRAGACDALIGRIVNLAYGRMVTINELATVLAAACGCPDIQPLHIDPRPGDVITLQADTRLARELLSFRANINLSTGLDQYLAWFQAHHNDVAALLEREPRNW